MQRGWKLSFGLALLGFLAACAGPKSASSSPRIDEPSRGRYAFKPPAAGKCSRVEPCAAEDCAAACSSGDSCACFRRDVLALSKSTAAITERDMDRMADACAAGSSDACDFGELMRQVCDEGLEDGPACDVFERLGMLGPRWVNVPAAPKQVVGCFAVSERSTPPGDPIGIGTFCADESHLYWLDAEDEWWDEKVWHWHRLAKHSEPSYGFRAVLESGLWLEIHWTTSSLDDAMKVAKHAHDDVSWFARRVVVLRSLDGGTIQLARVHVARRADLCRRAAERCDPSNPEGKFATLRECEAALAKCPGGVTTHK
jgi:hypothetical protein